MQFDIIGMLRLLINAYYEHTSFYIILQHY